VHRHTTPAGNGRDPRRDGADPRREAVSQLEVGA
jgi:hypothetical protein